MHNGYCEIGEGNKGEGRSKGRGRITIFKVWEGNNRSRVLWRERGRRIEEKAEEWGKKGVKIHHEQVQISYDECVHYVYQKHVSKINFKKNKWIHLTNKLDSRTKNQKNQVERRRRPAEGLGLGLSPGLRCPLARQGAGLSMRTAQPDAAFGPGWEPPALHSGLWRGLEALRSERERHLEGRAPRQALQRRPNPSAHVGRD